MRMVCVLGMVLFAQADATTPCMPADGSRGVAVSGLRELLVDAGERAWLLQLGSDCPDAQLARRIQFRSATGDGKICSERADAMLVRTGADTHAARCEVSAVHELDPAAFQQALAVIRERQQPAAVQEAVCFDPQAVRRWQQRDRQTLQVQVRSQGSFLVHLANACGELRNAQEALFRPAAGRLFCGNSGDQVIPLGAPSPRLQQSRLERQGCPVLRVERAASTD